MKHFIQNVVPSGNLDCEAFGRGLLELRNNRNHTGRSPAQVLYGHPLCSYVLAHVKVFQQQWQARSKSCDLRSSTRLRDATERYDANAKALAPLLPGSMTRIQDLTTKRWDKVGTVLRIGNSCDYFIRMPSARVWRRNHRFFRLTSPQPDSSPDMDSTPTDLESSQPV